jgi:glycosyltransferase involved in cell wall biosynthesis
LNKTGQLGNDPTRPDLLVVLSNWSYPGQEGLHLQNAAVLQALCSAGLRIHVLAFARDPALIDTGRISREWGPNVSVAVRRLRLNYPLLLLQSFFVPARLDPCWREFQEELARIRPHLIHLEGIGLSPWLARLRGRQVLMSAVDAWSLRQSRLAVHARGAMRIFLRAYGWLSLSAERRFYPLAAAVHVVSDEDAAYLRQACPGAKIETIPVGLMSLPIARSVDMKHDSDILRLVFWGDLRVPYLREGLLWLLREVVPRLPDAIRASIELVVLGRSEPDHETLQASAGTVVRFMQWVDDIDAELRDARVVLLPDASGSGMKNRTLQAMACGAPVLGSRFALEGIAARDGVHCFVRNEPEAFASALEALLTDPAAADAIGQRGRQLVMQRYSMQAVTHAWQSLYASLVTKHTHGDREMNSNLGENAP